MTRWSHGHSIVTGAALMALTVHHLAWMLTVTFAAGVAAGLSWRGLRRAGRSGGVLLAARARTEIERAKNLRASRRVKLQGVQAKRDELERAYKRGYIEGSLK